MSRLQYGDISWERMVGAVEKVKERLRRAVKSLEASQVPYAIADENAVAAWVSRVDEATVRNTQDVDILLSRSDLARATEALERSGFIRRHSAGVEMFLDGPSAKARDAVHVVFAGEKVRPEYASTAPDVSESERPGDFRVLSLEALVRMKLTSFRDKDRVHLRDLAGVGLVDGSWLAKFQSELAQRLKLILDTPEG